METVTITKKEYNALVFAKRQAIKNVTKKMQDVWDVSFGVLKNSYGKGNSVGIVRKMRKDWR